MDHNPYQRSFFQMIVLYRWATLLPAVFLLLFPAGNSQSGTVNWLVFGLVLGGNIILTVFNRRLNRMLMATPALLLLDILFATLVLAATGGISSPYYLYSLSPLIAGAFFFQIQGGLIAAGIFTPLFMGAVYLGNAFSFAGLQVERLLTEILGIWILPLAFGYTSLLLSRLKDAHDELVAAQHELKAQNQDLAETHQQLKSIYEVTVMLQAAPEVRAVQQQVLRAVTTAYPFTRATLGLIWGGRDKIEAWQVYAKESAAQEPDPFSGNGRPEEPLAALSLEIAEGFFAHALEKDQFFVVKRQDLDPLAPLLGDWLGEVPALLVPLIFHEQPVGVLLAASPRLRDPFTAEEVTMLKILANQSATALGTTMLCVERAQDLAVEQERSRIARDIHDTVSQSLFGIAFSLDACVQMLPENPQQVREELIVLEELAAQTRDQIRHSIFDLWPSSLTLDVFQQDISKYVKHCFSLNPFAVDYEIEGLFDELSPAVRRSLYRITQEALSNVIHHAGVEQAKVCLEIEPDWIHLQIQDEGRGFNPQEVLSRERDRERFGLQGIQERAKLLGGSCTISSQPGAGTQIDIQIPTNAGEQG